MKILGIETSCDETAVSIIEVNDNKIKVLADIVSSQVQLHAEWGGVVPNLAAREHTKNIIPVLKKALKKANISGTKIDLISVTEGPGLIPALLVGTNFAKTLSYLWQKPLLGIHHIEGHIYANLIRSHIAKFPILSLVVSGGHTQLILMKHHLHYEIIGETQDDAVGEAFDKVARILNLGYPGGPIVSAQANSCENISHNKNPITLPRPMINSSNFNFSFSGLKTAVLYKTKELQDKLSKKEFKKIIPLFCFEFQQACLDVLIHKTLKAIKQYQPRTVFLAGGVSANMELRNQLKNAIANDFPAINYQAPDLKYTGDNATMIAIAAHYQWKRMSSSQKQKARQIWQTLQANAGLKLS